MVGTTPEQLIRLARDLLKSEPGLEPLVRRHGKVGRPIQVERPRGVVTHWFVPVALEGRLAGYFLFDANSQMHTYSSFLRRPASIEGTPDLASWTDAERVSKVAAGATRGRRLGEPFLTYDGVPSRLAWAVPFDSDDGGAVYVAGDFAYSKPHDAETTG
jgi:hypothetical protein